MFKYKELFKIKNLKGIVISIVIFLVILNLSIVSAKVTNNINLNNVGITYENGDLLNISTDSNEINNANNEYEKFTKENRKINTNYVTSKTLLNIQQDNIQQEQVLNKKTEELEKGYEITIDDIDPIYIDNLDYVNWAEDVIVRVLLPTDSLYSIYKSSGTVPTFTYKDKIYSNVSIYNKVHIEKRFVPNTKVIKSKEDFLYYILHGDEKKKKDKLTDKNSIKKIQKKYKLTDEELSLNNPGIKQNQLEYDGHEIIVNKLTPLIKYTYLMEETKEEVIPFKVEKKYVKSMAKGEYKIIENGEDGKSYVTYRNVIVQGKVQNQFKIKNHILIRPKNEKRNVGTHYVPGVGTGHWGWPSSGTKAGITNPFGGWAIAGTSFHTGTDIQSWYGAPVYAADNGVVTESGYDPYVFAGLSVGLNHNNGYTTRYCHLSRTVVNVGDTVEKGQIIGYEGSTGATTGEHLHFSIKYNGQYFNPMTLVFE